MIRAFCLLAVGAVALLAGCGGGKPGPSPYLVPQGDIHVIGDTYGTMLSELDNDGGNESKILAKATPGQRMIYVMSFVDEEIGNGGYYQVFWNLELPFIQDAIAYAQQIGARHWAGLLRQAAITVLPGKPPKDLKHQRAAIGCPQYCDHGLGTLNRDWDPGEFRPWLQRYISAHPAEFFAAPASAAK